MEEAQEGDTASRVFDLGLLALIIANVTAVILETVPSLMASHHRFFHWFEIVSVCLFTVEYALRVWVAPARDRSRAPWRARLDFVRTPMALVDLIALLPFFLISTAGLDLRVVRAFRVFRVLRLFKLGRYAEALRILLQVIREKKEELVLAVTFALLMLLLASTVLFYAENAAQPDAFSSIPAAMWWGACTLTTVGYGDVLPITPLGKFLTSLISMIGVGLFALPAGILASGFTHRMRVDKKCPHCGETILQE